MSEASPSARHLGVVTGKASRQRSADRSSGRTEHIPAARPTHARGWGIYPQEWREEDNIRRVPIIITANDLSTLYAPLLRDGRMEKFYWEPTREDLVTMVLRIFEDD
eukprot:1889961-Pyramimonas_sp.AAC.1